MSVALTHSIDVAMHREVTTFIDEIAPVAA